MFSPALHIKWRLAIDSQNTDLTYVCVCIRYGEFTQETGVKKKDRI